MKLKNVNSRVARLALLLLLLAVSGHAGAARAQEIAARLDKHLTDLAAQKSFGGAALVARDGKVLLSKGYGMANYEFDLPNTPQTKFRLGSITKQFTAAAIMLLQEQGKLSVQDSICKYVEQCPAAWQPLTIHNLLTHTSGIPNFTGFPEYRQTNRLPSPIGETIKRFKEKPLEFAPGERFNYSNSGYILLGHIVEKVSGKSYEAFLQEQVFGPLKMTATGYDHPEQVLKNRASGYMSGGGGGLLNAPYIDMTIPHAAGALYSTVEDMYLWDQALHSGRLLSKKSLEAMLTPFKNGYGYGLGVGKQLGLNRIAHGGGIEGFNTFMVRFPDQNATVIVLSNVEQSNTSSAAARLARELLADKIVLPAIVKVDPAVLQSYAGRYEVDPVLMPNFILDITVVGDKLFIKPSHQSRHELAPVSATEFFDFDEPGDARFVFGRDVRGDIALTTRGMGPRPIPARKLQLPPPSLKGNTTFKLKGHADAAVVALAGTFNNWNQSQTLCAREGDGWV
ncbi:MAG: serine hydrolase, partial [Rubrivivax sp.]|nr:serine hydrolase [Pyrinomonadaceae bacterium]